MLQKFLIGFMTIVGIYNSFGIKIPKEINEFMNDKINFNILIYLYSYFTINSLINHKLISISVLCLFIFPKFVQECILSILRNNN